MGADVVKAIELIVDSKQDYELVVDFNQFHFTIGHFFLGRNLDEFSHGI